MARITALPFHEALLIGALRARAEGAVARRRFSAELGDLYGADRVAGIEKRLEEFFDLVLSHLRRPLRQHGMACSCVGADEAVLANLVSIATTGEREDAMLMACLLVRADLSPIVVSLAQGLGLELQRHLPPGPAPARRPSDTLH